MKNSPSDKTKPSEFRLFGNRLRFARKRAKLTQVQLAKAAGISQGRLTQLETGTDASSTVTAQLARACHCDPYWLATGKGDPDWPEGAQEIALIESFRGLSRDEQEAVSNLARTLATRKD